MEGRRFKENLKWNGISFSLLLLLIILFFFFFFLFLFFYFSDVGLRARPS